MIATGIVGLMIPLGCFSAGLLQVSDGTAFNVTAKRAKILFTVLDVDQDGVVELMEYSKVTDCVGEKLNMDEKNTKRIFQDYTKAWKALGFDKAENGHTVHKKSMFGIFEMGKHSPSYGYGVGVAFGLLSDVLRSYNSNKTITFDALLAFHYCIGADLSVTRTAFDKIDADKDGGLSEDELRVAGVDFMTGEDEDSVGSLLFG